MTNWWQKLETLRQEPEAKRRRLLWWSTSVITLVIVLIWLLAWRWTYRPLVSSGPTATSTPSVARETNWLADVRLKIITGWKNLIPAR